MAMFGPLLVLFAAFNMEVNAEDCIKTSGGNSGGACCMFPFTYKRVSYSTCTTADHSQPWCYTNKDKKWGNCIDIFVVSAMASSVLHNANERYGPQLAWTGRSSIGSGGYFHSQLENNPWLKIEFNKKARLSGIIIINRKDCCGERLRNLEIRAGNSDGLNNEIVGRFRGFRGPSTTGGEHFILFNKDVNAKYMTFQIQGKGWLQINGVIPKFK